MATERASDDTPGVGASQAVSTDLASDTTSQSVTATKRKLEDLSTEVVVLDPLADLTLKVGGGHVSGPKIFKINSGSLRLASPVFQAMLSGQWAESTQSEILFFHDSSNAFQILLQITHFMHQDLPKTLTKTELVDLAALCDRYQLKDSVLAVINSMKWLDRQKGGNPSWSTTTVCQEWALVAHQLKLSEESAYLINLLAMNIAVNKEDGNEYYMRKTTRVPLNKDLPDALLSRFTCGSSLLGAPFPCISLIHTRTLSDQLVPPRFKISCLCVMNQPISHFTKNRAKKISQLNALQCNLVS